MCQRQSIMSQCKAALRLHPSPLSAPGRGAGCKLGCTADGKQGLHMHMITTSRPLSLAVLQAQTWRSDWHPWYGCRIQGLETKADAAAPGCSALEKQPALAVQMKHLQSPKASRPCPAAPQKTHGAAAHSASGRQCQRLGSGQPSRAGHCTPYARTDMQKGPFARCTEL